MATRTLDSSPSILPLYARAALPLIPGASLLPFVPGGGDEIPDARARARPASAPTRADVAAYARVCGFALRDHLPPTYPHMLAFPLHMALMARRLASRSARSASSTSRTGSPSTGRSGSTRS